MKNNGQTETQIKVRKGLEAVKANLLEFKKRMNSELVVLENDKIVRIKPE